MKIQANQLKFKKLFIITFSILALSLCNAQSTINFKYASHDNLKTYEQTPLSMSIKNGIFQLISTKTPKRTILTGKMVNINPGVNSVKFNVVTNGGLALVNAYNSYTMINAGSAQIVIFNSYDDAKNSFTDE